MGVTNSNKTISPNQIACDGSLLVTLSLTAAPDIITDPTDIVLTLDRSSSMQGDPLANLKLGAKTFIDIIADATGGTASGQIGYGSRIGIVSFASTAAVDTQLITDVSTLKTAVDTLAAGATPTTLTPSPAPTRCSTPHPPTRRSLSCSPTAKLPLERLPHLWQKPLRPRVSSFTASAWWVRTA